MNCQLCTCCEDPYINVVFKKTWSAEKVVQKKDHQGHIKLEDLHKFLRNWFMFKEGRALHPYDPYRSELPTYPNKESVRLNEIEYFQITFR